MTSDQAQKQAERFWSHVLKTDACWPWQSSCFNNGYGQFKTRKPETKNWKAHRFAYELTKGPIHDGLTIDHLCRNKRCVNPDHLEAVTMRENWDRRPKKDFCIRGHRLTARRCKTCAIYHQPSRQPERRRQAHLAAKARGAAVGKVSST